MPPAMKTAVITGADTGVGRATADVRARSGYDAALLSRDPDRLTRTGTRRVAPPLSRPSTHRQPLA